MKIIERYILREYLKSFVFSLLVISFFYILGDLFSHIDEFIKNKVALSFILKYYYYNIFLVGIYILIPLSTVLASTFSFTNLMYSGQIIALRVLGWSAFRILRPVILFLVMLCLINFYFVEKKLPQYLERYQNLRSQMSSPSSPNKVLSGLTYLTPDAKLIFIGKFYPPHRAENVLILDQKKLVKLQAERGVFIKGKTWELFSIYSHDLKNGRVEFLSQKEYLLVEPQKVYSRSQQFFQIMPASLIKERIKYFQSMGAEDLAKIWKTEIYKKNAICFFPLFLNISIWGFILRIRKGHYLLSNFGIGIFSSFIFYVLFSVSLSLSKAGILNPILGVWFFPLLFSLWGVLNLLSIP